MLEKSCLGPDDTPDPDPRRLNGAQATSIVMLCSIDTGIVFFFNQALSGAAEQGALITPPLFWRWTYPGLREYVNTLTLVIMRHRHEWFASAFEPSQKMQMDHLLRGNEKDLFQESVYVFDAH